MEVINNIFYEQLTSTNTLAGTIEIFAKAFPNCNQAIQSIEHATKKENKGVCWHESSVGDEKHSSVLKNIRSNYVISLSDEAWKSKILDLAKVHNSFYETLLRATIFYQKKYNIHEPLFHEPYQVLKYQTGEEYKAHYDGSTSSGRFLSAIVYLNDDYIGGELEFPNFGIKIKPSEGDLILFPSNYAYAHIAHPVISGTKYAIVTWIHDRPIYNG